MNEPTEADWLEGRDPNTERQRMEDALDRDDAEVVIRVCCGHRHVGPVCPDGLVMCPICFKRVPKDRLALVEDGAGIDVTSAPIYEDVCLTCRRREDQRGRSYE